MQTIQKLKVIEINEKLNIMKIFGKYENVNYLDLNKCSGLSNISI